LFRAWFNGDEDFSSHGVPTCAFSCTLVLYQNLICNAIFIVYSFLEKLRFFLQAFSNCCGCFIATVMGHRIEPIVSIPTKLQTDSTGFTLESVIHIGCTPLLLLLWNPLVFRLFFAFAPYFKWILPSFERKGEEKE